MIDYEYLLDDDFLSVPDIEPFHGGFAVQRDSAGERHIIGGIAADNILGSLDSLPQHYKEAFVLYQYLYTPQSIIFPDQKTEDKWEAMQQMKKQYSNADQRRLKLYENYRDTYWYYYEYGEE